MKKILFYFGHPAQYHFAKNAIRQLINDGHEVCILIKTKDMLEDLVSDDGLEYINIQPNKHKSNIFSLAIATFERVGRVIKQCRVFCPDILIGPDASVAQAGWLLDIPCLIFGEDDVAVIQNLARVTYPFATKIFSPNVCDLGKWNKKKIGYEGYMKLAYLHPDYFTPKRSIVEKYIKLDKPYFLLRFARLSAHHDGGIKGINDQIAQRLVDTLTPYGNVYISSERPLQRQFEQYRLNIEPKDIHHLLAFATILIADSQSMTIEAAMLGTPAVRFNDFVGKIGVLNEVEQKYHLAEGVTTDRPEQLFATINQMLQTENLKEEYQRRRQVMLKDKIDVTKYFVSVIKSYLK